MEERRLLLPKPPRLHPRLHPRCPLARHPQLWQRLCLAAFANHGYIQPPEKLLHCFQWSYRTMFQRRKRLRFDGLHYNSTGYVSLGMVAANSRLVMGPGHAPDQVLRLPRT